MSVTAQIELKSVSKIYTVGDREIRVLSGIDLTIEEAKFVALAGPSGSGKTTLLHIIGAIEEPTEGTVRVGGRNLRDMSRGEKTRFRRSKIGFVFQAYNLIPVLTARENVEFITLLQGLDPKYRRQRSEYQLELVGLKDHMNKRPSEMSGGEQQRIAVARALAARPEIILADEPTANLDSKTGSKLMELFGRLNEKFKTTFLVASHDPIVIEWVQEVIRIRDGEVLT